MSPRTSEIRRRTAEAAIAWAYTPPKQPEAGRASLLALAKAGAEVARLAEETRIPDALPVNLRPFVVNAGRPVALMSLMERPTSEWLQGAPSEPMLVVEGHRLIPTEACLRWATEPSSDSMSAPRT